MLVSQLCLILLWPRGLPGSSVHGIFQAIVLEWIAISFSSGSSQPRDQTRVSRIVDKHFKDCCHNNSEFKKKTSYVTKGKECRKKKFVPFSFLRALSSWLTYLRINSQNLTFAELIWWQTHTWSVSRLLIFISLVLYTNISLYVSWKTY